MTGFGRTGKMFAMEYIKTKPDVVCIAKLYSRIYSLLRTIFLKKFTMNSLIQISKTFLHGHSFTANPLARSVAVASLKIFEK